MNNTSCVYLKENSSFYQVLEAFFRTPLFLPPAAEAGKHVQMFEVIASNLKGKSIPLL